MENQGKENLQEVIVAFLKLSVVLAESFKDGVQVADMAVILTKLQEPSIKELMEKAYQEIEKVPTEAKDLKLDEMLIILMSALPEIKELIKAVSK